MAALTNQVITRLGTTATLTAPTPAGDTFLPSARTFYYAIVGGTGTTFTFKVPTSRDAIPNVDISDLVVGPITSLSKMIGPFPAEIFADPTTGLITVTCNQATGVTVGVFDLSN
jgi:hypothetical protein